MSGEQYVLTKKSRLHTSGACRIFSCNPGPLRSDNRQGIARFQNVLYQISYITRSSDWLSVMLMTVNSWCRPLIFMKAGFTGMVTRSGSVAMMGLNYITKPQAINAIRLTQTRQDASRGGISRFIHQITGIPVERILNFLSSCLLLGGNHSPCCLPTERIHER